MPEAAEDRRSQGAPIAVTAAGVLCALGSDLDTVMDRLLAGGSGIGPVRSFDASRHGGARAAEVASLPPIPELPPSAPWSRAGGPDRGEHLLAAACGMALAAAGGLDGARLGLVAGTTLGGLRSAGAFLHAWATEGPEAAPLHLIARNFAATLLARTAARFPVTGPCFSISNACSSGADGLGAAMALLRAGEVDAVLAGGFDPMAAFTFAGFHALKLVTATACRPFAPDRDGFHLGEAAAVLLLEREEDARARGAPILGWLLGYGHAAEAHHLTQPDPEGMGGERALRRALADAGLAPRDVAHANLHATASPANDVSEYLAMRRVFGTGLASIPSTASKPALGHTLGAAGALEAAVALGSLRRGMAPPVLNTPRPDAEFADLDLVTGAARELRGDTAVSNSFGFGGSCACLVLRGGADGP